ncbi:hypothetical protein [Sporomusa sp. KB1]|uniref:hypothetical protein n=1 Tax=Sporomusa sp. KB1 TaxID=943346 RepID=UPI00119CEBF1|nr:hypothetical protein [Sporomusa sp. KB1]TWH45047.1 hypothetical protein Salpa_0929 [Sporomusa sp. KB1]
MKKLIFLTLIFVFVMSSIGMCAVPDPNTGMGDIQFGYNYYNLKKTTSGIDQGNTGFNEIYGSIGIGFGYGVYINHLQADGTSYTDFGLNTTPLLPNISLMVGQRQMKSDNADSANKLFCGASIKQDLAVGVAAYATYQKGTQFKDEVIGFTYDMENIQMNLSWKNYDDNNGTTFKGIGGGVNFQF